LNRFIVDTAWHVYVEVAATTHQPAESAFNTGWQQPADLAQAQVTRIDLATLAILTVPLLQEPLCPSCFPDEAETTAIPTPPEPYELCSRPKKTPDTFRTRDIDEYRLPTAGFANPVVG